MVDRPHGAHPLGEVAQVFLAVLAGAEEEHLAGVAHAVEHLPAALLTADHDRPDVERVELLEYRVQHLQNLLIRVLSDPVLPELDAEYAEDRRLGLERDLVPREAVLPEQVDRRLGVAAQVRRLGRHRRVVGPAAEAIAALPLRHLSKRYRPQRLQLQLHK